jgi:hypothetical protein
MGQTYYEYNREQVMTRTLLLLALLVVLLLPDAEGVAFESPLLFESPVLDGGDGRITAQMEVHTYLLPSLRVGTVQE